MIEGMLTNDPKDLNIGDVIITNSGSEMRCYKVEEVPRVSKKTWNNGKPRYIAVKCRAAIIEKTASGVNSFTGKSWTRTWKEYEFKVPDENDSNVKVDLNFKNMYIINK